MVTFNRNATSLLLNLYTTTTRYHYLTTATSLEVHT